MHQWESGLPTCPWIWPEARVTRHAQTFAVFLGLRQENDTLALQGVLDRRERFNACLGAPGFDAGDGLSTQSGSLPDLVLTETKQEARRPQHPRSDIHAANIGSAGGGLSTIVLDQRFGVHLMAFSVLLADIDVDMGFLTT